MSRRRKVKPKVQINDKKLYSLVAITLSPGVLAILVFVAFCLVSPQICPAQPNKFPYRFGPLFDHFDLTLEPGDRSEWFGPIFHSQQSDGVHEFGVPPLFSQQTDP